MVKFTPTRVPPRPVGGGGRSNVTAFSRASRKRMIELLCSVSNLSDVYLLTLTYPGTWQPVGETRKRDASANTPHGLAQEKAHLDQFIKRMRRRWPNVAYIWRLEPQKRGAPHYHLLIWNIASGKRKLMRWVTAAWRMIAHSKDEYQGKYATRVDRINNFRHGMHYVSKYVGKVSEEPDNLAWGRRWGKGGKIIVASATIEFPNIVTSNNIRGILLTLLRQFNPRWHDIVTENNPYDSFTIFGLEIEPGELLGYLSGWPEKVPRPP